MTADIARERHPALVAIVDVNEPRYRALRAPQGRATAPGGIARGSAIVAKLAGSFILILIGLPIVAVLFFFAFELLKLAASGG